MKRFKAIILLAAAVCLTAFISCKEEDEVETMLSGFMTGYTDSDGYISVLNDDMGHQYMVSDETEKFTPDTLLRMVVAIELVENNSARILQKVFPIAYKAPEDSVINDSLRVKDPVQIESIYIGGGFLNLNLGVKVQKEGTKHKIGYTHLDTPGKLSFTIYHNAYGDGQVYTKHAYLSIPLAGYGLGKNDTVFLSCKGYQEDYGYKLIYR